MKPQQLSGPRRKNLPARRPTPKVHVNVDQAIGELSERMAERLFVKKTKRSNNLDLVSKRNTVVRSVIGLKVNTLKSKLPLGKKGFDKKSRFFLGPKKLSAINDNAKFAMPKHYVCGVCNKIAFHLVVYLKHIRRHKISIRCSGCNVSFKYLIQKRRHELDCPSVARRRII